MFAAGRTSLRLYGLLKPEMREYLHTLYQFTDDWLVSDARFRDTFGDVGTALRTPSPPPSTGTGNGAQTRGRHRRQIGLSHDICSNRRSAGTR
jgi:hypothetical protein